MRFKILLADPPWAYQNWTDAKNGAAASAMECVPEREMSTWPVRDIAAEDSLLFLWATFPKLDEAVFLMECWGFEFVTTPFVWVKTTRDGLYLKNGPGFWTMSGAECVLLGRRGRGVKRRELTRGDVRQVQLNPDEGNVVTAPVLRHSQKPLFIHNLIVDLVGDIQPRIELFARVNPGDPKNWPNEAGWEATGLEYDGATLLQAIEHYKELAK